MSAVTIELLGPFHEKYVLNECKQSGNRVWKLQANKDSSYAKIWFLMCINEMNTHEMDWPMCTWSVVMAIVNQTLNLNTVR